MNAITKEEQAALTLPQRAAVALGAAEHEVKLRELVKSSADIVAVIDPAGREQAHRIGMTLKTARVSIEKTGKAAREDATAFSKAVIAEEKRLVGLIVPEEERVLSLRDQFDHAEQARKDALIAAERARTDAILSRIDTIRDLPLHCHSASAAGITSMIETLRDSEMTAELFAERLDDAVELRERTMRRLIEMRDAQAETEAATLAAEEARKAEAARIEAERQELAKLRAEAERVANEQAAERQRLANLAAAQERAAAELRAKAAANLKAEQDALAEQVRIQREASAEVQRQLAAQQAEIEAQRAAFAREQEEAAARVEAAARLQADHAEALLMDGEFDAQRRAQIESDHAEALIDNAQHDTDRAANLVRCTETAKAMLSTGRSLVLPESYCERDALIDAGLDEAPTDDEILNAYVENFGGTREQAIERLAQFDAVAARAELVVAA